MKHWIRGFDRPALHSLRWYPVPLGTTLLATLLTAMLVIAAPAARATVTVYTDEATFQAVLAAGAYVEDFTDGAFAGKTTDDFSGPSPATTYAYTAAASENLWQLDSGISYVTGSPDITTGLSTFIQNDPVSFTITSGNVSALGGVFFLNDLDELPIAGDFTVKVTDTDGTINFDIRSTSSLPLPFRGFVSDKLITKVELTDNGTLVTGAFYAVTHLSVGAKAVTTTPGAPTGLSATPGDGQATIAFTAPASDGGAAITDYEYQIDSGSWVSAGTTTSPLTITGLTNGTTYSVKLRALNNVGAGTASSAVSVTPVSTPVTPGAPTGLSATPGNGQATIAFTAPASDGGAAITDYEYQIDSGSWVSAGTTTSPLTITGLTNGTTYSVKLRAVNSAGAGAASSPVNVTPAASSSPPGAPTNLVATPGDGQASITFSAPATDGGSPITNYEYQLDDGTWTAFSPATTSSPVVVTGLTNGTEYTIKLRAVNTAGSGAASDPVKVTPRSVPAAPTGLVATPGNGQASISFTPGADGGSPITNYEYQLNGGTWTAFSPATTSSPVVVTSLTNGTEYTIKLRAVNTAGSGAASDPVTVTPRAEDVDGECGSAIDQATLIAPTASLCTSGVPTTPAAGNGGWNWTCTGIGDGANAQCITAGAAGGIGSLTFEATAGGCAVDNARVETPPNGGPPGLTMSYGVVNFRLSSCNGSATVRLTFSGPVAGQEYWKYIDGAWVQVTSGVTLTGSTATFLIVDNGPYDANKTLGIIEDPSGPAQRPLPIPTLSTWGLLLTASVVGLLGAWRRRKASVVQRA